MLDIPIFQASRLRFNNPENLCLENISAMFNANKDLFKLAFMNGSLGSNDYIQGWSDADIFAVVSKDVLVDMRKILESPGFDDNFEGTLKAFQDGNFVKESDDSGE